MRSSCKDVLFLKPDRLRKGPQRRSLWALFVCRQRKGGQHRHSYKRLGLREPQYSAHLSISRLLTSCTRLNAFVVLGSKQVGRHVVMRPYAFVVNGRGSHEHSTKTRQARLLLVLPDNDKLTEMCTTSRQKRLSYTFKV